jgi:ParB-like chromosome segregation protein Spo0J
MLPPGTLKPAARNARTHSKKQVTQVANSISEFGFINPIVADGRDQVVAGHARLEAAKQLRLKKVPVIRVSHLTETQLRALMLADNKIASNAGWDRELLATELGELQTALPECGLDLAITGFEPAEVDP